MPMPSLSIVPSAAFEKGRQSPVGESAGVFEKHMNIRMSFSASTPPVRTMSESPARNSCIAICRADRLEAQAASVT